MTKKTLVAVLSTGKGTWGHVGRLIADEEWEKIILISNEFGKEKFTGDKPNEWVVVNPGAPMDIIIEEINKEKFPKKVALNLASGTGKEHTALLAALREQKVDFELVTLTKDGIKFY